MQQLDSPAAPALPPILESLRSPDLPGEACPRRAQIQLDLLLLALEAADLTSSEAMLSALDSLELKTVVRDRVHLWRLRSSNPMRRYSRRQPLTLTEAKALALVICHLSRRLSVLLRQLLMGHHQLIEKQLGPEHYFRLADYLERFRSHFRARMNPRRAGVIAYSTDESLNTMALALLAKLMISAGSLGSQRLWNSLFEGEVL